MVMLGSFASAADEAGALSGIMLPGTVFQDLMVPFNPLDRGNLRVLSAARAEIAEPASTLRISGLDYSVSEGGTIKFHLRAHTAVYDFLRKTVATTNGFNAGGGGLRFEGSELAGTPEDQAFDANGHLEIQIADARVSNPASWQAQAKEFPPFRGDLPAPAALGLPDPMALLVLVQEFSGNLATFMKCWRWVEKLDPAANGPNTANVVLVSPGGGQLDLRQIDIRLAGSSMLIGAHAVMISGEGMRFRRVTDNGNTLIRMTGQGGIKTWMHAPHAHEVWIRSNTFECVSDHQIMQFQGGPLIVCRQGITLVAAEDWQFVRILANRRLVLSPGSWNVVGELNNVTE